MMTANTWLKDALRNIKKRIVSWLSIVTIVFIGTTLILGLYFGSSTVTKASVAYIDAQNFKDFDVSCTMGITEDEITRLKELKQINDAEGQISISGIASLEENSVGITIISTTDRISIPTVLEGRLPLSANECIVSYSAMGKIGAKIGDEIDISSSTARFSDVLKNARFTITGVASHPDYMVNTSTDYVVLPKDSFDTSELAFDYSNILVDADITKDTFKAAYKEESTRLKDIIKNEADSLFEEYKTQMQENLDAEYDNASKKAKEELAKGKTELDDATKLYKDSIASALEQLEKGEEELNTLKTKAEKELAEAKKKIQEGEEEYKTQLENGEKELIDAEKQMEAELELNRWRLFDGFLELDKAEKLLNEKQAEYDAGVEKLLKAKEELDKGISDYNNAVSELNVILSAEIIDAVISALEAIKDDTSIEPDDISRIQNIIDSLNGAKGQEPVSRGYSVLAIYDGLLSGIDERIKEEFDGIIGITDFRNALNRLSEIKGMLDDYQRQYDEGKEKLEEAKALLDQGWFNLEQGKIQLAEAQAEFDRREPEARKQLQDAKDEFEQKKAEGARQLEEAKAELSSKSAEAAETIKTLEEQFLQAKEEYTVQKEDGQKKIDEATSQYEEAKKETEDKLSETRAQIDEAKNSSFQSIIRTRDVNAPFVQTKSFIKAIAGFFGAFTPLYAAIIAIVCFFTMTIIIEEQTAQIGTCKAFGMYESEIMRKYIVFGTSAAMLGAALGVAGAFAIEKFLINTMRSNLAFSLEGVGHNVIMIILLPLMEVIITASAVLWSCHKYIRCSAVGLINGNEPLKKTRRREGKKHFRSIYLNLIFNNLLTDIGREVVSVVVIVMCVFLVGFGIDIKLAYEGALKRQMNDIWQFDLTLTESGTITEEEKAKIKQYLASYDTLYLPVTAGVITDGDSQVLTGIIIADDKDEFGRFFILKDYKGKAVSVADSGVLVTKEMEDKNNLSIGSTVELYSGSFIRSEVDVKGIFKLYVGKTMIMTGDYYSEHFGEDPVSNTYYIKAGGTDAAALKDGLLGLPGVSSVELSSNLRDMNMAVVNIYNAVVAIVILFSVMLSFMILLNLSNILVAHRMRELLTMRVNGFYNSQVIGYLAREVIATGVLAIVIALVLGMPSSGIIIKSLETDAFMFVREPFIAAWAVSVLINILFSVVINLIAFRKVNKVPLTDISKY